MNRFLTECEDCDGDGCWKCDDENGLVEITEEEADAINNDPNDPRIIIVLVEEPRIGD